MSMNFGNEGNSTRQESVCLSAKLNKNQCLKHKKKINELLSASDYKVEALSDMDTINIFYHLDILYFGFVQKNLELFLKLHKEGLLKSANLESLTTSRILFADIIRAIDGLTV